MPICQYYASIARDPTGPEEEDRGVYMQRRDYKQTRVHCTGRTQLIYCAVLKIVLTAEKLSQAAYTARAPTLLSATLRPSFMAAQPSVSPVLSLSC